MWLWLNLLSGIYKKDILQFLAEACTNTWFFHLVTASQFFFTHLSLPIHDNSWVSLSKHFFLVKEAANRESFSPSGEEERWNHTSLISLIANSPIQISPFTIHCTAIANKTVNTVRLKLHQHEYIKCIDVRMEISIKWEAILTR